MNTCIISVHALQQVAQMDVSGSWSTTTTAESENEVQLEDLKSGDPKKLHKLNKELAKQNRQLSKSVESLRKERDSLLSDKQKLKSENKSLEKDLKRSAKMEKGHQQLLRQESIEIAEDGVELPKKVEWLEAQLAKREGEIANLQRKLELKAELFESSKGSGLVVNAECHNCNPESEVPQSKLAMQKNGDALNMNLALERLLEQQDITSRYRQENSELKLRISSLEAELEQVFVSTTSPKTHRKASALFKRGKRHSSGKLSDETPTGKVTGAEMRVSKSPDFSHICNSSQEHLADSISPQNSPRHFLPRNRSGSAVTDVHTLQACLKLALEEKQSLVSQKQELEEKLQAAKNLRKPSQPYQEVELLKQTLKVVVGEKGSLSEQLKVLEREVATAKERTEDLEKRLAESLVQKDSFAEQQREIKALREENKRLKKSLADSTAKNSKAQQLEQQNEKLRKEIAELRASGNSKPAAKSPVAGNLEQHNEKLKKEAVVVRASAGNKPAARNLEQQNEKLKKEAVELRVSAPTSKPAARNLEQQNEKLKKDAVELRVSAPTSKPAARNLEQQNEKLKKEGVVVRASAANKPAARNLEQQNEKLKKDAVELRVSAPTSKPAARNLEQQNEKLKKDAVELRVSAPTSKPAARNLEQQNEKLKRETVVSSESSKPGKFRKLSTGKLKEGDPTSPKMNTVAATRALFEEKIEDSRQQAKSLSPKHNRNSVILGRERRGTTWNGSESGPSQAEENPVTIPSQTRAVSTISLAPSSKSNITPLRVSPPPSTQPTSTSSSTSAKSGTKPGAQAPSKMSISVKSSGSPMINTCKDIKEVEVPSPKKELSSPGSIPHQNQTQHPPIRKSASLTIATTQPVVSLPPAKKKEIQVTSHVISPGSTASQQDLGKPKSPSYTHTITPTPSPPAASVPTRTEKATFKQVPGKLTVQSSIEVKRASSLQNIPENVSTSSSLTVNSGGGGTGTTTGTSPTTKSSVVLRQNRRAPKQRPKTLHADTVNLTSIISKLQEQEKKEEKSRPPRPTSVYGGETPRYITIILHQQKCPKAY